MGRYDEACESLQTARAIARDIGWQSEYNIASFSLGGALYGAGKVAEARKLLTEVVGRSEASGCYRDVADASAILAETEFASGSLDAALRVNQNAVNFFKTHSNVTRLPMPLCNSAAYLIALGRYSEAREVAREALSRSEAIGSVNAVFWAIQHLAAAAVLVGEEAETGPSLEHAAELLGFVDEMIEQRGKKRYFTEQHEYRRILAALQEVFGCGARHEIHNSLLRGALVSRSEYCSFCVRARLGRRLGLELKAGSS